MNNLSSYCGLTDSRMRAFDTDLPVPNVKSELEKCPCNKNLLGDCSILPFF